MTWVRCAFVGAVVGFFVMLIVDGAAYGTGWRDGWNERQQAAEKEAR